MVTPATPPAASYASEDRDPPLGIELLGSGAGRFLAVTRFSQAFIPTLKDAPADAEALSHKLMVRAGLIRQVGAGLWSYLPAGWRVERKVEGIIREEMEGIGCQEMLMPVLQPSEIWETTGRYGIEEMFKLEDRKGSPLVLAMTHEECITH